MKFVVFRPPRDDTTIKAVFGIHIICMRFTYERFIFIETVSTTAPTFIRFMRTVRTHSCLSDRRVDGIREAFRRDGEICGIAWRVLDVVGFVENNYIATQIDVHLSENKQNTIQQLQV